MQHHTNLSALAAAGMTLCLPLTSLAGDLSPMSYTPAPAAASDCECADPGWTLELTALYLQVGATEDEGDEGDADLGYRGSLAYETASGLFFETRYFGFEGELYTGYDLEVTNWDFLIGDTICCSDKLAVQIAAGVRLSSFEEQDDGDDIEGIGPVISIEAERSLGGPWSLYAGITQAFVIGDNNGENSSNGIYGMTEIAGGVQYAFGMGPIADAYVRLGGEGQYYYGGRDDDTEDFGLFGGALSVGFNF